MGIQYWAVDHMYQVHKVTAAPPCNWCHHLNNNWLKIFKNHWISVKGEVPQSVALVAPVAPTEKCGTFLWHL